MKSKFHLHECGEKSAATEKQNVSCLQIELSRYRALRWAAEHSEWQAARHLDLAHEILLFHGVMRAVQLC